MPLQRVGAYVFQLNKKLRNLDETFQSTRGTWCAYSGASRLHGDVSYVAITPTLSEIIAFGTFTERNSCANFCEGLEDQGRFVSSPGNYRVRRMKVSMSEKTRFWT